MLRGKFIGLNVYIQKEERSKVNHLSFYLKKVDQEQQIKSKGSKRKEIIRINAGNSLPIQAIGLGTFTTKARFWSLVRELTSHKPGGMVGKKRINTKVMKLIWIEKSSNIKSWFSVQVSRMNKPLGSTNNTNTRKRIYHFWSHGNSKDNEGILWSTLQLQIW